MKATLSDLRRARYYEFGRMGWEDESQCPKCGYTLDFSIDAIKHNDMRRIIARLWCPWEECTYEGRDVSGDDWDLETEVDI